MRIYSILLPLIWKSCDTTQTGTWKIPTISLLRLGEERPEGGESLSVMVATNEHSIPSSEEQIKHAAYNNV